MGFCLISEPPTSMKPVLLRHQTTVRKGAVLGSTRSNGGNISASGGPVRNFGVQTATCVKNWGVHWMSLGKVGIHLDEVNIERMTFFQRLKSRFLISLWP